MWLVRYLFPFSRLLFCLNDIVLCYTEYFLFLFRYPIQKPYPVPMSSLSPFYFLLDSGYLALCWGPLLTKSWARCVDLFSLFCMQFDQHHLLKILGFPQCVELCLGLQFYSTGQHVCFYTNTWCVFVCLFLFCSMAVLYSLKSGMVKPPALQHFHYYSCFFVQKHPLCVFPQEVEDWLFNFCENYIGILMDIALNL